MYFKYLALILLSTTIFTETYSQINTYMLNDTIIGVDHQLIDIDQDNNYDLNFEIIDLAPNGFAARVVSQGNTQFLDNSTYGYPDALNFADSIIGEFNAGNGVLGTFNNAGQFNGNGNKFLGVKLSAGDSDLYGWVELNCSLNNDTIILITAAYNSNPGQPITAGQTIATSINDLPVLIDQIQLYPNPASDKLFLTGTQSLSHKIEFYNIYGVMLHSQYMFNDEIEISELPSGIFIIKIQNADNKTEVVKKIIKE